MLWNPVRVAVLPSFQSGEAAPSAAERLVAAAEVEIAAPAAGEWLDHVLRAPVKDRFGMVMSRVRREAATVLALEDEKEVDADKPLMEQGLDSLMAVELRNAISTVIDRKLPATLLFNYPTLTEMSEFLTEEFAGTGSGEQPESVRPLDDLSEAQVAELLSQKLDRTTRDDSEGGP
jgi:acyl carrier protein